MIGEQNSTWYKYFGLRGNLKENTEHTPLRSFFNKTDRASVSTDNLPVQSFENLF